MVMPLPDDFTYKFTPLEDYYSYCDKTNQILKESKLQDRIYRLEKENEELRQEIKCLKCKGNKLILS